MSLAFEATCLHGGDGLGVLHKGVPDEGGAEIFGHQEAYAEIDAEDVGVVPVQFGVEGVAESVAAPGVLSEFFSERAEDADSFAGKKGEGSGCGRWDDRAVDWTHERRATPGGVAVLPVGGADAPVVVVIAAVEAKEEGFVGAGRGDGVGEVVGVGVALAGEVEPGVGELVDEEGISSADVGVRAEGHWGARKGAPGLGGDGMGGRTDGEEVEHHQFGVVVPACGDEAGLGTPAHGEGLAAVEHPWPVDAVVELCGEVGDSGVVEVGACGENAAQQDRGIDGRDFAVDQRLAGFDVVEVIEEAVLVGHFVQMELQGGKDLLFEAGGGEVTSPVGDA